IEEGDLSKEERKEHTRRIDLIPDLLTHELFLTAIGTLGLLVILYFRWFNSPLEHHANPQQTPLDTKAPWYFWWLQGMLKIDPAGIIENLANGLLGVIGIKTNPVELSRILNSKFIMGLVIPPALVGLLMAVPYIDRNPSRLAKNRPFAIAWGIAWIFILFALSYMGLPEFGIETPPATRIIQDLAPEEGLGELREIPYEELVPGVYTVGEDNPDGICKFRDDGFDGYNGEDGEFITGCPHLSAVFADFSEKLLEAEHEGNLPDLKATFTIEQFAPELMRLIPHVFWTDPESGLDKDYKVEFYLHADRSRTE
ncbi:MAG: hypothetical protein N2D54_01180, partial [Chloroflexota bacterium]